MAGVRRMPIGALENGLVVALALSVAFLALAVLTSPVLAAAVAVPASLALGVARAHRMTRATPHCLAAPAFGDRAVIVNASRAAAATSTSRSASSAA